MREETISAFRLWLKTARGNSDRVIGDKISRCRRVERHYDCDLDELDEGCIRFLLGLLCCSPSGVPRHGIRIRPGSNLGKVTADLKNAVRAYFEFRMKR